MLMHQPGYWLFLLLTLLLYWALPRKRALLLGASLVFYGVNAPAFLPYLLFCCVSAWWLAPRLPGNRKLLLASLAFYFGALIAAKAFLPLDRIPLGISFFTFHLAAYLIDVYRKSFPPENRSSISRCSSPSSRNSWRDPSRGRKICFRKSKGGKGFAATI